MKNQNILKTPIYLPAPLSFLVFTATIILTLSSDAKSVLKNPMQFGVVCLAGYAFAALQWWTSVQIKKSPVCPHCARHFHQNIFEKHIIECIRQKKV